MKGKAFILLAICLTFLSCTTVEVNKYKTAQQLQMTGKEKEALKIYKDLCVTTKSEKYCSAYKNLRTKLSDKYSNKIERMISHYKNKYGYVPIPGFKEVDQIMGELRDIATVQEIKMLTNKIEYERKLTTQEEQHISSKLAYLISIKEYNTAFDLLESNRYINPEKFDLKLSEVSKTLWPKCIRLAKEERWHELKPIIQLLHRANPNNSDMESLYENACRNDSIDYYLNKAQNLKKLKEFDEAIKYYTLAIKYYPNEKDKVEPLRERLLSQLSVLYLNSAKSQIQQGLLAQGYFSLKKAYKYIDQLPLNKRGLIDFSEYGIGRYYEILYSKAKEFEANKKYGIAYFYYSILFDLDPDYPNLKKEISELERLIGDRAIKKIAVLTFKSPQSFPYAGTIIASNLIMKLNEYLRGDVKFIEKEAQPQLIKELELKLLSGDTLQLSGIDFFIVGEVLSYKVETIEQKGKKTIQAKIGTERVPNPEYEIWLEQVGTRKHKDQTTFRPPRYIEKPIYRLISYDVKNIKKVGLIDLACRIVDIHGKVVYAKSEQSKELFTGESTEGIEVGDFKIPFKMANLESDSEILELVRKKVVEKLARDIQKLFINCERNYLKQAENSKKKNAYVEAMENYANAIVIMKAKGLPMCDINTIKYNQMSLLDLIES